MEDQSDLREATENCLKAFRKCSSVSELSVDNWLGNQLGNFNSWAANFRVLETDHTSLDYRLRNRDDARDAVKVLLKGLETCLGHCIQIAEGGAQPFGIEDMGLEKDYSMARKNVEIILEQLYRLGVESSGPYFHDSAHGSSSSSNHLEGQRPSRPKCKEEELYFLWYHLVDLGQGWREVRECFRRQFPQHQDRGFQRVQCKFFCFIKEKGCPTVVAQRRTRDEDSLCESTTVNNIGMPKVGVVEQGGVWYPWMRESKDSVLANGVQMQPRDRAEGQIQHQDKEEDQVQQ